MKNAFLVPHSYMQSFSELSDEELGMVFRAMFDYDINLKKPNFTDRLLKTVWLFVESNLDSLRNEYDKRCETSAKNGEKGGRPRLEKPKEPKKNLNNLTENLDNLTEPNKPDNDNDYKYVSKYVGTEKAEREEYTKPRARELESYEEIMDDMQLDQSVRPALWNFIKHCQLNDRLLTNSKLIDILSHLDFTNHTNDQKIEALNAAISGGYYDIKKK